MNLTTLEMSNKLKEIGAPQDTDFGWYETGIKGIIEGEFCLWSRKESQQYAIGIKPICAAYDLESLIGWLGDNIYSLLKRGKDGIVEGDSITLGNGTYWEANNGFGWKSGRGDTPLEAVYALAEKVYGKEVRDNPL